MIDITRELSMSFTHLRIIIMMSLLGMYGHVASAQNTVGTNATQTNSESGESHLLPVILPEITPAELDAEKKTIQLPGSYSKVVVGGGGRFLIFQLKLNQKLVIFDVSRIKFVKKLTINSSDYTFTAGADKLVVLLRDKQIIERYDLVTFKKELARPVSVGSPAAHLTMGAASNGPILVGAGKVDSRHQHFLDLKTLEPSAIKATGASWHSSVDKDCTVQASANGRLFCICRSGTKAQPGMMDILLEENTVLSHYNEKFPGLVYEGFEYHDIVLPSPDGNFLYTPSGVYTKELNRIESSKLGSGLPAVHGEYCVKLVYNSASITLHVAADHQPIITLPEIWKSRYLNGLMTAYRRLFFIPDAQLLVFLPENRSQIVLHHFELDAALKKSDKNYFVVSNNLSSEAERGTLYESALKAKSNQGSVKFRIVDGPSGMTVSSEGLVQWQVPSTFSTDKYNVSMSFSDASGQELFRSYQLVIRGKLEESAVPDKSVKPLAPNPQLSALSNAESQIVFQKYKGKDKVLKLPNKISDVVTGGGGRYLLLYLKASKKIAVYDVNKATIIKFVSMKSDDAVICAGASKFIVVDKTNRLIERWSLTSFEREAVTGFPFKGEFVSMAMGNASEGPVLMHFSDKERNHSQVRSRRGFPLKSSSQFSDASTISRFVDLETLNINSQISTDFLSSRTVKGRMQIRASANGTVFNLWEPRTGMEVIVFPKSTAKGFENKIKYYHIDGDFEYACPNTNGKALMTRFRIYSPQLNQVIDGLKDRVRYLPTTHPNFYISLPEKMDSKSAYDEYTGPPASIFFSLTNEWVADLPVGPLGINGRATKFRRDFSTEKRVHYVPQADQVVTIPYTNDQLQVKRFSLSEAQSSTGEDQLSVSSFPPWLCARGQELQYQLQVESNLNDILFELSAAPEGMELSESGKLTWSVPENFQDQQVVVIITLTTRSGETAFHAFHLEVK